MTEASNIQRTTLRKFIFIASDRSY